MEMLNAVLGVLALALEKTDAILVADTGGFDDGSLTTVLNLLEAVSLFDVLAHTLDESNTVVAEVLQEVLELVEETELIDAVLSNGRGNDAHHQKGGEKCEKGNWWKEGIIIFVTLKVHF